MSLGIIFCLINKFFEFFCTFFARYVLISCDRFDLTGDVTLSLQLSICSFIHSVDMSRGVFSLTSLEHILSISILFDGRVNLTSVFSVSSLDSSLSL